MVVATLTRRVRGTRPTAIVTFKRKFLINKIFGNTTGLRVAQIKQIERLGRRGLPPENIITNDLARQLASISREINRQIGLLINRKGEISSIIVGDHKSILIPDPERFRSSSARFRGLRLIHTHLNAEELSDEDLTDLSHLRLDLIGALEVHEDGSPGVLNWAHLVPENPAGDYRLIRTPEEPHRLKINFLSFIQALEDEFTKKQKVRKIDAAEKAILLRVEKIRWLMPRHRLQNLPNWRAPAVWRFLTQLYSAARSLIPNLWWAVENYQLSIYARRRSAPICSFSTTS